VQTGGTEGVSGASVAEGVGSTVEEAGDSTEDGSDSGRAVEEGVSGSTVVDADGSGSVVVAVNDDPGSDGTIELDGRAGTSVEVGTVGVEGRVAGESSPGVWV
jgi:hypothetical protein